MNGIGLALLLEFSTIRGKECLRFEYSYEQGFDTSCGLAALACLMEFYWGIPIDEAALAGSAFGDDGAHDNYSVSFADLARILRGNGFIATGYRMDYQTLVETVRRYSPVLAHYAKPEGHFALVLAGDAASLIVADPAVGTYMLDRKAFESRWSGAVILAKLPGAEPNRAALEESAALARGRMRLLEQAAQDTGRGHR